MSAPSAGNAGPGACAPGPAFPAEPTTLREILFQLYHLARIHRAGDPDAQHTDLERFAELAAALQARLNTRPDRRSARHQRLRDELVTTLRAAFPQQRGRGLAAVAEFQASVFQRRPLALPGRWPLVGEHVAITTAWSPDNSSQCVWERRGAIGGQPLPPRRLRRLDRAVRRLERHGYFGVGHAAYYTGHEWMDTEPDAYPGLHRLIITLDPPAA